jgi:hypothetical protein
MIRFVEAGAIGHLWNFERTLVSTRIREPRLSGGDLQAKTLLKMRKRTISPHKRAFRNV